MPNKPSSHLGAGLIAGTVLGVAAALFLKSPKGKRATRDLVAKSHKLQRKLLKELGDAQELTKQKYESVVDQLLAYYVASREVAKTELPEIRAFLLSKWSSIRAQLESAKR